MNTIQLIMAGHAAPIATGSGGSNNIGIGAIIILILGGLFFGGGISGGGPHLPKGGK